MTSLPIGGADKAPEGKSSPGSPPRMLLLTAHRWLTPVQLALGFVKAGLAVDACCLAGHPLTKTKIISRTHRLNAFSPSKSLRKAIETCQPNLLVPTDDISVRRIHKLYAESNEGDAASEEIRRLVAISLGDPINFSILYSRDRIAKLARMAGVSTPPSAIVRNEGELVRQLRYHGLRAVLKTDGSYGGTGVRVVRGVREAKASFRRLVQEPTFVHAVKRFVFDKDPNQLVELLRPCRPLVSIHGFISGVPANAAVACWEGEMLAHVCVEVLLTSSSTGPAKVVRVIKNPMMSDAVERMVRVLKLSGLCGFDFILDDVKGRPYLIDLNPRATQTCHLAPIEGRRLLDSLAMKLNATPDTVCRKMANEGPIVLFPHGFAFAADAASPYSKFAYEDMPTGHPELMELGRDFYQKKNSLLARILRGASKTWFGRMLDAG